MSARSGTTTGEAIGEGQLRLLPTLAGSPRRDWQLDDRTREVGRRGVALAREVLRQARPPEPKQPEPIRKAS